MPDDPESPRRPEGGTGFPDQLTSETSLTDEKHGETVPQGPGELGGKVKAEAAEGNGPVDKAKRVLQEFDRDIGGEYERRQDPEAETLESSSDG